MPGARLQKAPRMQHTQTLQTRYIAQQFVMDNDSSLLKLPRPSALGKQRPGNYPQGSRMAHECCIAAMGGRIFDAGQDLHAVMPSVQFIRLSAVYSVERFRMSGIIAGTRNH